MSKAFTREETDGPDLPEVMRPLSALPPGAINYMTADGTERLRQELARLVETERPCLVAKSENAEAAEKLALVDQQIFQLEQSLQSAHVISHPKGPAQTVTFGATVTVRGSEGHEVFRIVGVDETDHERGHISWLSPVARALMTAKVGQQVSFKYPCGEEHLEVISIVYE
jgi:transcription elongation factor GreB